MLRRVVASLTRSARRGRATTGVIAHAAATAARSAATAGAGRRAVATASTPRQAQNPPTATAASGSGQQQSGSGGGGGGGSDQKRQQQKPREEESAPARGWKVWAFWGLMGASTAYNAAKFPEMFNTKKEYKIGALFGLAGPLNSSREWVIAHNLAMCTVNAAAIAVACTPLRVGTALAQALKWPVFVGVQLCVNTPLVLAHYKFLGDFDPSLAAVVNLGGITTSNAALCYWLFGPARLHPRARSLAAAIGVFNFAGVFEFAWIIPNAYRKRHGSASPAPTKPAAPVPKMAAPAAPTAPVVAAAKPAPAGAPASAPAAAAKPSKISA